jgi:hemolysin III
MATVSAPDDTAVSPRRRSRNQTLGEEIANAVTHGLGAGLALAGLVFLVVLAALHGTALHVAALALYGATLVTMFLASTLYHAVTGPRVKEALRIFDHVSILLLIAGTYTPFTLISLGGAWGWGLFVAIWALALAGILLRIFRRHTRDRVTIPLYLGMGWLGVVAAGEFWGALGPGGMTWIIVGGLAYSGGVIFYAMPRLPFHHAVWHLFVIAGSACHFVAVAGWVLPTV